MFSMFTSISFHPLSFSADSSLSTGSDCVYLCGNSLGLQPKRTAFYLERELDKWATLGVEGHVSGDVPWAHCDELAEKRMADLVGANREEVTSFGF